MRCEPKGDANAKGDGAACVANNCNHPNYRYMCQNDLTTHTLRYWGRSCRWFVVNSRLGTLISGERRQGDGRGTELHY